MMLGGQNKTFHWNNGVKKHFGWVCCHTQAQGHMLLGSAGPTGEEGISANHAKVLQHILHFCPVLVRITARMQSEFVNSAYPPAKIPLKKKNLKAHTLPEHHQVPSKPPDHKNKRDRRWLIWNESPSLQRCVLGTTNRSLPAALLCGPIPSPARQCLLGTLTSIFLGTLLLDHRHQLSEVMHVFPSVRPSANCSDQKSFRSNPNILYPSCFLSCHHNYKSQGTQQRFSLTDQKATDPHISDFTNTL